MTENEIKKQFTNRELKQEIAILKRKCNTLDTNNKTLTRQFELRVNNKVNEITKDYKELLTISNKEIREKNNLIINLNQRLEKLNNQRNKEMEEKNEEIEALKNKLIELTKKLNLVEQERDNYLSKLNNDGNTSGISTSQTPIGKTKKIPNSREKSNNKVGGQFGHKKHKLMKFDDNEINEEEFILLEECPNCHSHNLEEINEYDTKDELDYEVKIIKKRYYYKKYKCLECNKIVREKIPNKLKEENQYGDKVQSLALSLVNVGNIPFNRTRKIINGLTMEEIDLNEGYLVKLQKRAADRLKEFEKDLYLKITKLPVVHWDDTVIYVNGKQNILRFYGDDNYAYYKAHETKSKAGIDEDNILLLLPKETKVVHDHNIVNYNDDYIFQNCECCQHLERDLEGVTINLPSRTWSDKLKKLFQSYNEKRKELIKNNKSSFTSEEINEFFIKMDEYILLGMEENEKHQNEYYAKEKEKPLLKRLVKYRDNYTYWLLDFEIPYTNNTAERGLRIVKNKMKVSGQFKNIQYAEYYALIKSYIETCYRHGINEVFALQRLMSDSPLTLSEIEQHSKRED